MRSWKWALGALLLVSACGGSEDKSSDENVPPPDGTAAGCAGSYEGTFEGDVTGTMTATVESGGSLNVTIVDPAIDYTGNGSEPLGSGANLSFAVSKYMLYGDFDLTTCTGSGTWAEGRDRGTWTLTRVGG